MSTQIAGPDVNALAEAWANRGSETPAQTEPAPAEGSTPEVEAAPAPTPVETPSPEAQTGTAVDDPDIAFALEKAGVSKDDPQALAKLSKLFRETNNRTAQFANELEALKKAPPQQPVTPPVQAQPTQAPPAEPQQTLDQHVETLVQQDREFTALAQDFEAFTQELTSIATFDRYGRLAGGRIAELNRDIAALQAQMDGAERLQKMGLKAPDMDDFQKQEIRAHLTILSAEKAQLRSRYQEVQGIQKELNRSAVEIRQRYKEHIEGQISERQQAEQEEQEINQEADRFKVEWSDNFKKLATDKQVPEKIVKKLWDRLKKSAKAHDGAITNLNQWMTAEMDEELSTMDEYHRARSGQHAQAKREDIATQTAPANPAAVAPPAPGASGNWEDGLRERHRAVASRRA